ncbi:hypothetical protein AVEN_166780-1 [Araneus ventricosus]|uniref:Uncharacterized protein n=1 Tax=Araneus ventricosus TaxID=182803 RepID=A0A4Y2BNF8_ARAVE|nr:hypothetical protein AVEN_166780-1 [Araneus ventricosus]
MDVMMAALARSEILNRSNVLTAAKTFVITVACGGGLLVKSRLPNGRVPNPIHPPCYADLVLVKSDDEGQTPTRWCGVAIWKMRFYQGDIISIDFERVESVVGANPLLEWTVWCGSGESPAIRS